MKATKLNSTAKTPGIRGVLQRSSGYLENLLAMQPYSPLARDLEKVVSGTAQRIKEHVPLNA